MPLCITAPRHRARHACKPRMSASRYNVPVGDLTLDLASGSVPAGLGAYVRDARRLVGWSQRELAGRAATTQSTVSRLEHGLVPFVDLAVVARIVTALGMRAELKIDSRHLRDRERQADAVHAVLNGYGARRLGGWGWETATEVLIGAERPRGWIDLLAFRPADRALLLDETKTDLPDVGGFQRSLAFYEREAWDVARGLGWEPRRLVTMALVLDSAQVADRIAASRDLLRNAFRGDVTTLTDWLRDPASPAPRGWTLAACDPASRADAWLRPTNLTRRRRPPAYEGSADAARRLGRSVRAGGR